MLGFMSDWMNMAQNCFTKSERANGFLPFIMIFMLSLPVLCGFGYCFRETWWVPIAIFTVFAVLILVFIVLFAIKCFIDPDFCRSEKHVQTIRKLDLMQSKGDKGPQQIMDIPVRDISPMEPAGLNNREPALVGEGVA